MGELQESFSKLVDVSELRRVAGGFIDRKVQVTFRGEGKQSLELMLGVIEDVERGEMRDSIVFKIRGLQNRDYHLMFPINNNCRTWKIGKALYFEVPGHGTVRIFNP